MNEKKFLKILDSREQRSFRQKELIEKYNNTLISFTINAPGIDKNRKTYNQIHKEGYKYIIDLLLNNNIDIIFKEYLEKETGNEAFLVVSSDSYYIKKITIDIENSHILGRIFDIDVFDKNFNQISRRDLGFNPRKCLLCDNDARVCIKEKRHKYEELIGHIDNIWKDYKNKTK